VALEVYPFLSYGLIDRNDTRDIFNADSFCLDYLVLPTGLQIYLPADAGEPGFLCRHDVQRSKEWRIRGL